MAINYQRMRFDTCDCVVRVYHDTVSDNWTVDYYEKKCSAHQTVPNNQLNWDYVLEENRRKTISLKLILDNAPNSIIDTDVEGNISLKKGIYVSWSLSGTPPDRMLTLIITGITLTQNQRNAIQTKLDQRFNLSNVIIING